MSECWFKCHCISCFYYCDFGGGTCFFFFRNLTSIVLCVRLVSVFFPAGRVAEPWLSPPTPCSVEIKNVYSYTTTTPSVSIVGLRGDNYIYIWFAWHAPDTPFHCTKCCADSVHGQQYRTTHLLSEIPEAGIRSLQFTSDDTPDSERNGTPQLLLVFSKYHRNAQFFYSSTIYMLHYALQHVSSSALLIIRRTNCITTASGIVTLCTQPYSMRLSTRILFELPGNDLS